MALNTQLSNLAVNTMADAIGNLFDDGYLRIYDGAQPANADTAITTQTLLAELRFGNPACGSAVAGVLTFNAITPDSSANATGTASWARCLKSDGSTVICDGSVGLSAANFILSALGITLGQAVAIDSGSFTVPKS